MVKTMNENFISVDPVGSKKTGISGKNLKAIRDTLIHLQEGHPVGFFPSGAVSDFSLRDLYIRDREWQESILHLIHSVKVPVLPIRFFDNNSPFFYFLGMINWKIRSFRMPSELFNKRKHDQRIGIGNLITVRELEQFPDIRSLGVFLRRAVYEMPVPSSFTPRTFLNINEPHREIITA
jgi:putative hemolysin